MSNEGLASPIIRALEETYDDLRTDNPDLPADIVFVMGQGKTKGGIKWGHFATGRWTAKDAIDTGSVPEVLISAECLAAGGHQVMQTLAHEAVHALAQARNVKETSRQGRYHNKKFVTLAEELGLTYPHDKAHDTIGWSAVILTDAALTAHEAHIERFDEVIKVAKDAGLLADDDKAPVKKPRVVAIVTTEEGEVFEVTDKVYEKIATALKDHDVSFEIR